MRFGDFDFYPERGELLLKGHKIHLQQQPLRILKLLLEQPGELVSRESMQRTLWGDAHADHEHGINTAIRKLRDALRNGKRNGISIITISGEGYRLLLPSVDHHVWTKPEMLDVQLLPAHHLEPLERSRLECFVQDLASALSQTTGSHVRVTSGTPSASLVLALSALEWHGQTRLTALLMQTGNESPLWTQAYDISWQNTLTVQSRLVRDVASVLTTSQRASIPPRSTSCLAKTLAQPAPLDAAGYEAYLDGRFFFSQRNPGSLATARKYFEIACELNPDFACAHACLSRTCRFLTIFETENPGPLWQAAEHHAIRAVELDGRLSEAQSSLGCVLARYRWRWLDGCAAYEEALRLNPNDPETRCDYGVTLLAMGELQEGVRCLDRVLALDPRYAVGRATVAMGWMMQGKQEKAMAMLTQMTEAMPDFLTPWIYLGVEQLNMERWSDAEASFRRTLTLAPANPTFLSLLANAFAGQGRNEEAAATFTELTALSMIRYVSPTARIFGALAAGDRAAVLKAVDSVVPERDANFALYRKMLILDSIRGDPAFLAALEAMDLRNVLNTAR